MRLWHKDLIDILPREQLVAQWRECSAIAGSIQKSGTPNHVLVNYVVDNIDDFIIYSKFIRNEMTKRGYRTMDSVMNKITALNTNIQFNKTIDEIFTKEHDRRYFTQCIYNLQEKFDRGGILSEDWQRISTKYESK